MNTAFHSHFPIEANRVISVEIEVPGRRKGSISRAGVEVSERSLLNSKRRGWKEAISSMATDMRSILAQSPMMLFVGTLTPSYADVVRSTDGSVVSQQNQ